MNFTFEKASKAKAKLRMALIGISGSGKTYSSLAIAAGLGKKIAVIDTEKGSASKYADLFEFDVLELGHHSPTTYVQAIKAAEKSGYDVIVIDSLSHAWMGNEGALAQVDNAAKRSTSGNSYVAWRDVTPQHNALIDAIVGSECHIIATMRSKTEYSFDKNAQGKMVPKKIGTSPIQRDGMEYEFDIVADMTQDNDLLITKTRCAFLRNAAIHMPSQAMGEQLLGWLNDGVEKQVKDAEPLIDEEQLEELTFILSLSSNASATMEYIKKTYKVEDVTKLTADDACKVIDKLKASVSKRDVACT